MLILPYLMGAGNVKSQQPSTQQPRRRCGDRKMACEACRKQFSLFSHKRVCADCGRQHCSKCVLKSASNEVRCQQCSRLASGTVPRNELMQYSVKDLRMFLVKRQIPMEHCTEKTDLVELILQSTNREQFEEQQELQRQRIQELQEHIQSTEEQTSSEIPIETVEPPTETPPHHDSASPEGEPVETEPERRRMSLAQVNQQSDINELTVKQLKEILAANFVNYKGCCEKWELIDRVTRLWKEDKNNQLKAEAAEKEDETVSADGDDLCKVCMAAMIDCVLLDCGHMVTCTKCGKRMAECPVCRQYVVRVVHTFRA